jgi:choline transport protein
MALALASFWNPGYSVETWHVFLIFQAMNFLMVSYNIFLLKRTIWLMDVGCKWFTITQNAIWNRALRVEMLLTMCNLTNTVFLSLIAFFVITITCLAESNPKQSSDFVWREFVNTSGWSSDGVVFLTGLVNPNFIFSGLDGAIHLAEECTNAAVAVPRALVSTVAIGFVTALVFAIGMCYSYHDFDAVLASP